MSEEKNDLNAPAEPAAGPDNRADVSQDPPLYDGLKLPDGILFDDASLDAFKTLSQEMGLSLEQVQKLVDFEGHFLRQGISDDENEKQQILESWAKQTKEMYGPDFEDAVSLAVRAADAFGGPELRQLLETTGLGNHPVIVRTFNEIGKRISEDSFPGGKSSALQDKTFAEALYGKNN